MINSDPLQDFIYSEACCSFRRTHTKLFKHIDMTNENISFKIRNHLPAILPNQIYHTTRGAAVKLLSGLCWYSKQSKQIKKLATLPTILAGINIIGGLKLKAANLWLGY